MPSMPYIGKTNRILQVNNRNHYSTLALIHHFTLIYNQAHYINDFFFFLKENLYFSPVLLKPYN